MNPFRGPIPKGTGARNEKLGISSSTWLRWARVLASIKHNIWSGCMISVYNSIINIVWNKDQELSYMVALLATLTMVPINLIASGVNVFNR